MKFQTLKKSRSKRIAIAVITFVTIISIIAFKTSYASYRTTQSINIASGRITYSPGDLNVVALKVQQEEDNTDEENYNSVTDIPIGDYVLNKDKSYCFYKENDAEHKVNSTMSYDNSNGTVTFNDLTVSKKGTKCYLYFDIYSDLLPKGYKQLEYIQASEGQYIDTGLVLTGASVKIETQFMPIAYGSNNYCMIFGVNQNNSSSRIYANLRSNGWGIIIGSSSGINLTRLELSSLCTLELNVAVGTNVTTYVKYNNTTSQEITTYSAGTSRQLYLFADNEYGTLYAQGTKRIYYFRVYMDGNISSDFYPVKRNSDGVLGMYDVVRNTFYTNAGTGTFVAGPEV